MEFSSNYAAVMEGHLDKLVNVPTNNLHTSQHTYMIISTRMYIVSVYMLQYRMQISLSITQNKKSHAKRINFKKLFYKKCLHLFLFKSEQLLQRYNQNQLLILFFNGPTEFFLLFKEILRKFAYKLKI